MSKVRFTLRALAIVCLTLFATSLAQAQATRTWVSGVGDDANPCSRTAPCKTYAGAISKTARDGEISTLDPGGFGAVTITKSITINGGGGGQGYGSILASGTNGVVINITDAADTRKTVRLEWLSINGTPVTTPGLVGVKILSAKVVSISNTVISNFYSNSAGNGRGIFDNRTTAAGSLFIDDTTVRNSFGAGIVIAPGAGGAVKASLNNVRVVNSGDNGLGTGTGTGIVVSGSTAQASISHSLFSRNATFGVGAEGGGDISLDSCWITMNGGAGLDANGAGTEVRMSNTVIYGNLGAGLGLSGGTIRSYGNNMIRGNNPDTNPTNTDLQQ